MEKPDAVIFIDANQYLDLYRTVTGKRLLSAINEQQEHIFVTVQVAEEVQRNKLVVAAIFLAEQFKQLKLRGFDLPDHLFDRTDSRVKKMRGHLQEIHEKIRTANEGLIELEHDLLEKISRSDDEVSKALAGIFAGAVSHDEDELKRARARKERGNAPGKKGDPLGDQLSWEQILNQCKKKSGLWIISRDKDYVTSYGRKAFINAALYQELCRLRPNIEVFCFNNIPDGIQHFAERLHVKAEELPTPEESEEIKKEQETLPPLGWLPGYQQDTWYLRNVGRPGYSGLVNLGGLFVPERPTDVSAGTAITSAGLAQTTIQRMLIDADEKDRNKK